VWTQPKTLGTSPHPRQYHTAGVVDDVLYIFGGYDGTAWPNELVTLNFRDFNWRIPKVSGDLPKGREGHAMCVEGSVLYVFGGWDCGVINDLHSYDTRTAAWTKLDTLGKRPAVCGHSLTLIGRTIYIFGGYDGVTWLNTLSTLDLDTLQWREPEVVGSPLARGYHSATAVNRYILVFAGYNGTSILGDLLAFDTTTCTWSYPEPCFGRTPASRNAHSMTLLGSELYIFGGYNGTRDVNELHVLETAVFSTIYDDLKAGFYEGTWQEVRVWSANSSQRVSAVLLKTRCPELFRQVKDGQVTVQDCSAEALQLFCENLYSDLQSCFSQVVQADLMYLAVTYNQPRLQALCFGSQTLPDSTLVDDMAVLREEVEFSDFVVKVQETSFYLHKFVVASRCPYFKALLESGMREAVSERVELPQVTAEAFGMVVEWIYTDKFAPLFGDAVMDSDLGVRVLLAANMLGLSSLMRMAEIALQRAVTLENVLVLYEVAHLVNAIKLMSFSLNFILKEFDSVSCRRDFSEISEEAREELIRYMPRRLRRQSSLPCRNAINSVLCALKEADLLRDVEVTPRNPVSNARGLEARAHSPSQVRLLNIQGVRADHCLPTKDKGKVRRRRKNLSPLTSPKRGKLAPLFKRTWTLPHKIVSSFDFVLTGSNAAALSPKPFREPLMRSSTRRDPGRTM
jgi:hypothetical protein